MLKLKQNYKTKLKIFGTSAAICALGLPVLSFYTVPEQVKAASSDTRTLDDLTYMQEMNKYVCENAEVGDKVELIDTRDSNKYTVGKLSDKKCWMTQNLRLVDYTTKPEDSQTGGFSIPNAESGFSVGSSGESNIAAYYNGNRTYGAYYSWYTATAFTGADSLIQSQASGSICAKGWKLPTKTEYDTLSGQGYAPYTGEWLSGSTATGVWLGSPSGRAYFSAAGYYSGSSLNEAGGAGNYWTSLTFENSADSAYAQRVSYAYVPTQVFSKEYGLSVRCLADDTVTDIVRLNDARNSSLSVKVAPTISIDAVSGMSSTVTPSQIATGNITATVATNATSYQVLLHAEETALLPGDTAQNAHDIPTSTEVAPNKTGWGILNADKTTYSAMTTKPTQYYNESSTQEGVMGTIHSFGVGVSVSSTLPADTYSTQVTVTAAAV